MSIIAIVRLVDLVTTVIRSVIARTLGRRVTASWECVNPNAPQAGTASTVKTLSSVLPTGMGGIAPRDAIVRTQIIATGSQARPHSVHVKMDTLTTLIVNQLQDHASSTSATQR